VAKGSTLCTRGGRESTSSLFHDLRFSTASLFEVTAGPGPFEEEKM